MVMTVVPASTCVADKAASRASSAPASKRERRSTERGPKRGVNFGGNELDELVMTSELVPTGRKYSVDFDTLSTAPPSSAEQSPELACMASDVEAFPSLREAYESAWDFCSDDPNDEELWLDLPGPALPLEGMEDSPKRSPSNQSTASWWLVPGADSEPPTFKSSALDEGEAIYAGPAEATWAEKLQSQQGSPDQNGDYYKAPPESGTQLPAIRARPLQKRTGSATKDGAAVEDEVEESYETPLHGWQKREKTSWNKKQWRKVADRTASKVGQSCKSRGWLEAGLE